MPENEIERIAREFYEEGFSKGRKEVIERIIDPGCRAHDPFPADQPGPGAVWWRVAMFRRAFPDLSVTIEDYLAQGDRVVARWTASGTHLGELSGITPTNKKVLTSGITLFRVRGGKIQEFWTELDMLGLMVQIGAIPSMKQLSRQTVSTVS